MLSKLNYYCLFCLSIKDGALTDRLTLSGRPEVLIGMFIVSIHCSGNNIHTLLEKNLHANRNGMKSLLLKSTYMLMGYF